VAVLRTTSESGPIRLGKDVYLESEIRIVMRSFIGEAPFTWRAGSPSSSGSTAIPARGRR